jgi:hypothetical protein
MVIFRDRLSRLTRREVTTMDDKSTKRGANRLRTAPPRMTGKDIRALGRMRVQLTRSDLEHVAELLRAGMVLTKDRRPVSRNLRAAMTKLGVETRGL